MANIILKTRNSDIYMLKAEKDIITRSEKNTLESIALAAFEDNQILNEKSNMDLALWYKEKVQEILNCNIDFLNIDLEVEIKE